MNRMKRTRQAMKALLGGALVIVAGLALVGQAAAQGRCVPPPEGLVSWWPGDGNTEEIVAGRDGSIVGSADFAPGKVADAFRFAGGRIDVSDDPIWTLGTKDFTIDLWVNLSSKSGRDPFIAHDSGGGEQNKWIFWYDESGHDTAAGPALRFHINGPPSVPAPHDTVAAPWVPILGQWYHVAVTRSGNNYALYIDGVQVAVDTSEFPIPDPAGPLTIGSAESFRLNGLVDEVEIFHRALSASEIQAIFNAGSAGKCKTTAVALDIQPAADVNPVSTSHTVTATVTDGGGLPVSGIVVEFRVEGSVNVASSCLTNADGQCDVTYAGPAFPGADSITAFADSNVDGQQSPDEPSDTATKAWVLPTSTPGSVTGGGQITAGAGHVAFGFNARNTTKGLQGQCNVVEPLLDVHITCTDVTALVLSGTQATFLGNGTHNGAPVTYRIDVNDQGEPGAAHDTFSIITSSGYLRSGTLTNGNIQVRN